MATQDDKLLTTFTEVASVKQEVYAQTLKAFKCFKKVLNHTCESYREHMSAYDSRVEVKLLDQGKHQCMFQFGGDALVFNMHSNVFAFDPRHPMNSHSYIRQNGANRYFGVIHVYNFLADSFRLNRDKDLGYLIARIFVNREGKFFVEGKGKMNAVFRNVDKQEVSTKNFQEIVSLAIEFALHFELYVPSFEHNQLVTVGHLKEISKNIQTVTAKRLGFKMSGSQDE